MRYVIFLMLISMNGYGQKDSSAIHQEVFPSLGRYGLVTLDRELYSSVIHGSFEFINEQKPIELNKALQRRKTILTIKAKCNE